MRRHLRESHRGEQRHGSSLPWVLTYMPELDGIRCFAVLAVVAHHSRVWFGKGGFLGVDIFFVLSGFLITSILIKEHHESGRISLGRFFIRRSLRLWPALIVVCLVCLGYGLLFPDSNQARVTIGGVPASMFYVANWVEVIWRSDFGLLSHTWSLALEEQFYLLVAPAMVIILARRVRFTALAGWLAAGAVAVAVYRASRWTGTDSSFVLYRRLDTRADALLIGCALAALCAAGVFPRTALQRRLLRVASLVSIGVLVVAITQVAYTDAFLYRSGGLTLLSFCAAAIIYQIVAAPFRLNRAFDRPPVVLVGRMSYSLYLWHNPMINIFGPVSGVAMALRVVLGFAVAALSYFAVEQPFLRLKDRFGGISKPPLEDLDDRLEDGNDSPGADAVGEGHNGHPAGGATLGPTASFGPRGPGSGPGVEPLNRADGPMRQ